MNFSEIIKTAVLNIINSIKLTETFVGEVIDSANFKIKIEDKIILTENEIIRNKNFLTNPKVGTKILLIREQGGQKYYLINSIIDDTDDTDTDNTEKEEEDS